MEKGESSSQRNTMSHDENLATIIEQMMIVQDEESDAEIEKIENASLNDQETNEENLGSPIQEEDIFVVEELKIKNKKKALMGLRCKVQDAILGNYLLGKPTKKLAPEEKSNAVEELKETTLWGVPLLPSKGHEAPENLPVEYGGLKRENDPEFSPEDKVTELTIRGNATASILIPTLQVGVTVVWDMTVVGWNVAFKEEFIPDDEGSYRILLQSDKDRKAGESLRNSFYINEPGKIMITIDNGTLKKKRVLYRYRTKPTVPSYIVRKELGI